MSQHYQIGDAVRITFEWLPAAERYRPAVGRVSEVMHGSVSTLYRVQRMNGDDTVVKAYEITPLGVLDELAALDQLPERAA